MGNQKPPKWEERREGWRVTERKRGSGAVGEGRTKKMKQICGEYRRRVEGVNSNLGVSFVLLKCLFKR